MIAAIYARLSVEQKGMADESRSCARQVTLAREFAVQRGWKVVPELVFKDDGYSGAEFERRPALMRLMSLLKPRPRFQILIVSEQKSIGREMAETSMTIKELAIAGVEIFEYGEGRSLTPKNWLEKAMSAVRSAADEAHREDTSRRVTEAHTQKAKAGYVVGGRIFGYRNHDVIIGFDAHDRPLRSHVERVICEEEAEVVRRIFTMYDSGLGQKAIAAVLNREGALRPKPFASKDGLAPVQGWAASTVRAVLTRELYNGVQVWRKTRKKNDWGQLDVRDRPESEWVRTAVEHLRIVSADLWKRVVGRRREVEGRVVRFEGGRICGRPRKDAEKNLLAGLATCGVCGGGLVVEQSNNRKGRYAYYICHRRRHFSTCTNTLRVRLDEMNEAVLRAVEEHALTPEAVEEVIRLHESDEVRDQEAALARERKDVATRIARLVAAIETGGDSESLVTKVRELEARKRAIDKEIANLQPIPRLPKQVIEDRLTEWRRLLRQSTAQGRAVLQRVLQGRLTFTPRGEGYEFAGPTRFDKLFTGIVLPLSQPNYVRPGDTRGLEGITAEDTLDGDYGRLLERAYGKGVVRPAGLEPATSWFVARRSIQLS
jgi:site-specific DNA recombinase